MDEEEEGEEEEGSSPSSSSSSGEDDREEGQVGEAMMEDERPGRGAWWNWARYYRYGFSVRPFLIKRDTAPCLPLLSSILAEVGREGSRPND